jgi:hypothetical protein
MTSRRLTVLCILCCSLIISCRNTNSAQTNKHVVNYPIVPGSRHELLKDAKFVGTVQSGNVQAFYPSELQSQAECLADLINKSLSSIESNTGFKTSFNVYTIYLLQTNEAPCGMSPVVSTADHSDGVILLAQTEKDTCESIIAQNPAIHAFFHEIIEGSLLLRKEGTRLKNDYIRRDFGLIKRKVFNYTRWFREGFSTYCSWLAHESMTSDSRFGKNHVSHVMMLNGFPLHPFSALEKIGKDLFSWHQFYDPLPDTGVSPNLPNLPKSVIDYYDASFGLFLLIQDQFGQDAIRRIILSLDELEYADGPALINITNTVLNTDIKQLVEDFHFPKTGLYMEPLFPGVAQSKGWDISEGCYVTVVERGSTAEKAGIRENDVIHGINDRDIKTNLDFELAMYQFRRQPGVKVYIWREKEGELTRELKVE